MHVLALKYHLTARHALVIPALGKSEASLGYILRPNLKRKKKFIKLPKSVCLVESEFISPKLPRAG
jgi:hypothetical protein